MSSKRKHLVKSHFLPEVDCLLGLASQTHLMDIELARVVYPFLESEQQFTAVFLPVTSLRLVLYLN